MKITTGRTVLYKLRADDAAQINRRRVSGAGHGDNWPAGAQAHIGNFAQAGDVVPLAVVRVWPDEYGPGIPGVNGQAILDGNDTLWVTSAAEGEAEGQWSWPKREE